MIAVAVAPALLAAGCNAFSSVLQRKANRQEPEQAAFSVHLLLHLVRRPAWVLGGLSMLASFLLQATALSIGTLTLVEPVLVFELPLTLILSSVLLSHALHPRDWATAAAMAGGLGLMIVVLAPSGGNATTVPLPVRIAAVAATLAWVGFAALGAQLGPLRARAALFGVAAGSGFGLTASLIKIAVARLSEQGLAGLFTAWETYGVAVAGAGSVILVQAALHAGTLVAAQPGITLLDPLVSILWGVLVLQEHTREGPILSLAALGAAVIVVAVLILVRQVERAHPGAG
jgi:drug/metabolite transporter (DMT)-like permease